MPCYETFQPSVQSVFVKAFVEDKQNTAIMPDLGSAVAAVS